MIFARVIWITRANIHALRANIHDLPSKYPENENAGITLTISTWKNFLAGISRPNIKMKQFLKLVSNPSKKVVGKSLTNIPACSFLKNKVVLLKIRCEKQEISWYFTKMNNVNLGYWLSDYLNGLVTW